MSVWVVVGGQYGSEGKGKIAAHITISEDIDVCVRCGGPNSGHSFVRSGGTSFVVRQLPTGFVSDRALLLIPAGALVDPLVLRAELEALGLGPERVRVDRNAMVIEPADKEIEAQLGLNHRLSSTLCGVGAAQSRRVLRAADVRLIKDIAVTEAWLRPYIDDAAAIANDAVNRGNSVLVEGTQGFGLSLYHTREFPKATSRDTTAAAFVSEVGLSPLVVSEIVVVLRTFPIRVAGLQAGTLRDEVSWDTIRLESGCPYPIEEVTTVTQKTRRIGRFDWELAERAVAVNRPTRIALNGLDYFSYADRFVTDVRQLSQKSTEFVTELRSRLGVPIRYLAARPELEAVIGIDSFEPVERSVQLC